MGLGLGLGLGLGVRVAVHRECELVAEDTHSLGVERLVISVRV